MLLPSLVAAVALADPAAAAETIQGSGAGTGYSSINVGHALPAFPLCLPGSQGSTYVVNVPEGIVAATETSPPSTAQYAGPLKVTITLTASFYFSPAGTFSDPMCLMPYAVPATIAVASPNQTAIPRVNCPADDGVFTRTNTAIEFNESSDGTALDGSCTVTSATTVTVSPVTHTFVGNEYPCFEDPFTLTYTCPNGLDTTNVQGNWTVSG
ncbi:MAG: hypothetical protein LC749_01140 [Actinobacteria bacterium]|nr:hypothetical protein [Actinomycetota bacterium]